jgi:hypothetical protein
VGVGGGIAGLVTGAAEAAFPAPSSMNAFPAPSSMVRSCGRWERGTCERDAPVRGSSPGCAGHSPGCYLIRKNHILPGSGPTALGKNG